MVPRARRGRIDDGGRQRPLEGAQVATESLPSAVTVIEGGAQVVGI